jgi:selenocysteine-specific elongation factor
VRVRGVQVHGHAADAALAGQRTALNLAGASTEDLSRGMTLVPPGMFETARRVDVSLRMLTSMSRPLKNRSRLHFHSYTMETIAEVVLYEGRQVGPGQRVFARLKLPEAALLLPGDRFILRQFSPVITIGGGVVLDAVPLQRMPERTRLLKTLDGEDRDAIVEARIAHRNRDGISMPELVAETGWPKTVLEGLLGPLERKAAITRTGEFLLCSSAVAALKLDIATAVDDFHKKNPLAGGIGKEELRAQTKARAEVFEAVTSRLVSEHQIEIAGDLVRLPGRGVVMKDVEAEAKDKIERAFATAGLKAPALNEVIAGLKIDKARAQKIVTLLLRERALIKISDELVFHRSALEELRRQMTAYKLKSSTIEVAAFKDLTGVSRKYAIPLLEYLDRERVTKRVGDARAIL